MTDQEPEEVGYAAALAELKMILAELEDDAADVDVLGTRVRRAAELITLCRNKIQAAEIQVDEIVAELAAPEDAR